MNSVVAELVKITGKEQFLLEQCKDFVSTVVAMQVSALHQLPPKLVSDPFIFFFFERNTNNFSSSGYTLRGLELSKCLLFFFFFVFQANSSNIDIILSGACFFSYHRTRILQMTWCLFSEEMSNCNTDMFDTLLFGFYRCFVVELASCFFEGAKEDLIDLIYNFIKNLHLVLLKVKHTNYFVINNYFHILE